MRVADESLRVCLVQEAEADPVKAVPQEGAAPKEGASKELSKAERAALFKAQNQAKIDAAKAAKEKEKLSKAERAAQQEAQRAAKAAAAGGAAQPKAADAGGSNALVMYARICAGTLCAFVYVFVHACMLACACVCLYVSLCVSVCVCVCVSDCWHC